MEVILTPGIIGKVLSGEVTSEKEIIPVMQVAELKLVQSKVTQPQQEPMKERYRMMLSDGTLLLQGMLGTGQNDLVKDKILQRGSIVRLTQFICNVIQDRRIIIVVQLEVIATNSDIIGRPVTVGKQPNNQHGAADIGNRANTAGFEQHGKIESSGGRQINNTEIGRNHAAISPQVGQQRQVYGTGSSYPGSAASSTGAYNSPAAGYGVPRQDQARDPPTTYPRQPAYQPQPQPQPQQPMYVNRGPVARNEAAPRIIPINALSPYSGRWTIKARVTLKGELRHYNNPRGDGKVFNFDLLDADGGEIRVTCFNAVADQFFDQIVVGNLYLVSRGTLKPAQKKFNHLPNDYEITLDNASTIQQCYEEDPAIPRHQFHFRSIGDIEGLDANTVIDVIGIVSSISPTGMIMKKDGTETQKRALSLKDMSGRSVEVTMWGNFCNAEGQKLQVLCDAGGFPVLAVKAGRVSEFNGKAVSTIGSTQLFIEPDFVEAKTLKEWFEREGRNAPCISISREFTGTNKVDVRKTIAQIKDEKLGTSEKPDWITVSATIIFVKVDNFCYTACPIMNGERPCSKKVTDNGDGTWRCEKCDKCVDECDYRYILQLQLQDHTGHTYVTAFQEAGEEIMGMPAKDLYFLKHEDNGDGKFEDVIRKVAFSKYIFKLKVKEETFSDEQRVKSTVVKVDKLNYSSDTGTVLDAMEKLRTGDANSLPIKQEGSLYSSDAGIGSSGARDPLPANQSGQFGNQYINGGSRAFGGGGISCEACGISGHVSANCPTVMSEPQGQYMAGSYRGAPGGYGGGGLPRQHVGGY